VGTSGHHTAEATFSTAAIVAYIYYTLDLRVIEQEAMYWTVSTFHKGF
jgi:hypothetical protein